MNRWKSRGGKSQRREEKKREEERRSEKRKSQRKEDAGARRGRKVAKHGVFQMICDFLTSWGDVFFRVVPCGGVTSC